MYASVDVGTTSVRLALYDENFEKRHHEAFTLALENGYQDAELLYRTVRHMIRRAHELGATSAGISTYRASVVLWKKDGTPVSKIATWLSQPRVKKGAILSVASVVPFVSVLFSGGSPLLRLLELLSRNPSTEDGVKKGELYAWGIDAYLLHRLSGRFATDATNAALSGFVNPSNLKPFSFVPAVLGVRPLMPEIIENTGVLATCEGVSIKALIGDQQAACVAEGALTPGVAKVTNGTGTFTDIPQDTYTRKGGLIPVVLLSHRQRIYHGLEGFLPTSGAAVDTLLRLGVLRDYGELELAGEDGGVFLVPSLRGLQLPGFSAAKGLMYGIDTGSDRLHIVRALEEAVAFHIKWILEESGARPSVIKANGKLSLSDSLLRLISDATGTRVERHPDVEGTARGLAMLQALSEDRVTLEEIMRPAQGAKAFEPKGDPQLEEAYKKWRKLALSLRNFQSLSR